MGDEIYCNGLSKSLLVLFANDTYGLMTKDYVLTDEEKISLNMYDEYLNCKINDIYDIEAVYFISYGFGVSGPDSKVMVSNLFKFVNREVF